MADHRDNISAGTQVVSRVEVRGTNNSLVHPRGAVGVVTRTPAGEDGLLGQYVNDRPYAASSFLSVAIADVFGTALAGFECKDRPGLSDTPLPLDSSSPEWGESAYHRVLEMAAENLHYDRLPTLHKERLKLLHGSLMYRDERLAGFDAAVVVEVVERLDPPRLAAFERVLFECARPGTVVLTTPNREYNVKWETLPAGKFRHRDHRFEWTRADFQDWANRIAERFGYSVRFLPVGPDDAAVGAPTQMGAFERKAGA